MVRLNHGLPGGIGGGGNTLQSTPGFFKTGPVVVCANVPAMAYDQSYATMFPGADDVPPSNVQLSVRPPFDISQVSVSVGPVTPNLAVATDGFVTDRTADAVAPPYDPVIVAEAPPPPGRVEIEKIAPVAPAPTVMLPGMITGPVLDNSTTAPPAGAAAVSVAVPITAFPSTTLEALSEIAARAVVRAVTVSAPD